MKKFENFCNALNNLKDIYKYEQPYDNVVLTGLVGLFEICFEQAWKAMKEVLEYQKFPEGKTGSPRQILKTAYRAGMINNEADWLSAADDRNNTAHAYNSEVALEIIERTKNTYLNMFTELKAEILDNWIE